MKNTIIALALLIALTGCSTSSGVAIAPAQMARFEKGITTAADVTAALGRPNSVTSLSDGTKVMTYVFMKTNVKGSTFVPIVGLFTGGAESSVAATTFSFDAAGRLVSYQSTESNFDSRNGPVPSITAEK